MKFYYPKSHYNNQYRAQLFPLLKPFIKGTGFTDDDRVAMYGVSEKDFGFAEDIETADVVILTMTWNYYAQTKQLPLAFELIALAKKHHKTVWSHIAGDFGVKIPSFNHVVVFRFSGSQSKGLSGHIGMPVFIQDYLMDNNFLQN